MDSHKLKEKLEKGEPIILLDVREPEEIREAPFFVSPQKYSLNIPILLLLFLPKEEQEERIFGELGLSTTTLVVTLCHSGGRSKRVCEQLQRFGWNAENLEGGVIAWGEPR